jgi:hypothetical protein
MATSLAQGELPASLVVGRGEIEAQRGARLRFRLLQTPLRCGLFSLRVPCGATEPRLMVERRRLHFAPRRQCLLAAQVACERLRSV